VTLRNPSKDVQRYRPHFEHAFELGRGSVTSYKVHGAWSDAMDWLAGGSRVITSDKPLDIELAPFEVLTIEAIPLH
jgi:hypothetical protein